MTPVKKTITSIFMVPTLKIPRQALRDNGFVNGYARDAISDVQYDNAIYVLFRPEQLDSFREFLDSEYERTKAVIDDYDHPGGFVVIVYQLDMKYEKDFTLVRQGRYSRTSQEFQELFPKMIKIVKNKVSREEISLQYRIFNRTEDLVTFWEEKFDVQMDEDQEIWHGFDEADETLTERKLEDFTSIQEQPKTS